MPKPPSLITKRYNSEKSDHCAKYKGKGNDGQGYPSVAPRQGLMCKAPLSATCKPRAQAQGPATV